MALERRVSVRDFLPDPVEDALVTRVLKAACRAPTSDNLQAYSFVVVRDAGTRRRLGELAGHQRHVVEAPVFIAVCADLHRVAKACERHGRTLAGETLEMGLVATIDASLAGMAASLTAESLGLGSVMIGGVRNAPLEVAALLGLPQQVFVAFGLCLGWPARRPPQKPRLPEAALIFQERYEPERIPAAVAEHDRALATHYKSLAKATSEASWTERIAERFSRSPRAHLRASLRALGFDFS
jgi:FMN reductase (NADPH)